VATSVVTTILGASCTLADGAGTAASFQNPMGLLALSPGVVLVADYGPPTGNAVRRLTLSLPPYPLEPNKETQFLYDKIKDRKIANPPNDWHWWSMYSLISL
jgi:hypothetical protein